MVENQNFRALLTFKLACYMGKPSFSHNCENKGGLGQSDIEQSADSSLCRGQAGPEI